MMFEIFIILLDLSVLHFSNQPVNNGTNAFGGCSNQPNNCYLSLTPLQSFASAWPQPQKTRVEDSDT
jgi:hypothetical protein